MDRNEERPRASRGQPMVASSRCCPPSAETADEAVPALARARDRRAQAPARSPDAPVSFVAQPAPASKHEKRKTARALPVRSSPVSTEHSLPSTRATLREAPALELAAPFVRKSVLQEREGQLLLSADLNPGAQDSSLATPALHGAEFRAPTAASGGEAQLPLGRFQGDVMEATPQRHDADVEPLRAEMRIIPARHGLDLDEEERQRIDVVLNSVRLTGVALSVGAVWWAARAAGLVASLLASSPAWRHVDPLPVLGRDEEEEEQWDETADAEDKEKRNEEHRAAWVLEGESRL